MCWSSQGFEKDVVGRQPAWQGHMSLCAQFCQVRLLGPMLLVQRHLYACLWVALHLQLFSFHPRPIFNVSQRTLLRTLVHSELIP